MIGVDAPCMLKCRSGSTPAIDRESCTVVRERFHFIDASIGVADSNVGNRGHLSRLTAANRRERTGNRGSGIDHSTLKPNNNRASEALWSFEHFLPSRAL